jgi:hypothetical protein
MKICPAFVELFQQVDRETDMEMLIGAVLQNSLASAPHMIRNNLHAHTPFLHVVCKHIKKGNVRRFKLVLWLPIKCIRPLPHNKGIYSVLIDLMNTDRRSSNEIGRNNLWGVCSQFSGRNLN